MKLAAHREVDELPRLLGDSIFEEAAGVLEMINQSPEDRQFYEARLRYLENEEARMSAEREAARAEGAAHGTLIGKIQILQEIIGESVASTQDLLQSDSEELSQLIAELQERLRSRGD